MKKIFLIAIYVVAFIAFSKCNAQQTARITDFGRGYLEYLPATYTTSTDSFPVLIFLHGWGERGTGSPADLEKVKKHGPPKHINNKHTMCFSVNGVQECFIVLSPQTNKSSWKGDVVPFVKYALAHYKIDPDRVYLTGLSMGGEGTWFGASKDDNSPNLFAAIAPVCGRASRTDGVTVASRNIEVWAFHGSSDTDISQSAGLNPILGMQGAGKLPGYSSFPFVGHNSWDRAYNTANTYNNPNLYQWLLMQKRK